MENWEGNLVDRELEWKGGNQGKTREKGDKEGEQAAQGRGMKEGAWGKGEGRGLITQVKDEGEGRGKGPCTRVRVFSSASMDKGAYNKAVHGGNLRQCPG